MPIPIVLVGAIVFAYIAVNIGQSEKIPIEKIAIPLILAAVIIWWLGGH